MNSTTNIIFDITFSLGLLVCVWYFFLRDDRPSKEIDSNFEEVSIKLDDYEKELDRITRYKKPSEEYTDWKEFDREILSDEDFQTLYQEPKDGDKKVHNFDGVE